MAFCLKCGTALVQGAAFCGKCGAPVSTGAAASSPPPAPPPVQPAVQAPPRYSYAPTGTATAPGLVTRVTNILTKPKQEWEVIAGESATIAGLYSGYICILAAIPVVAMFIQISFLGTMLSFGSMSVGITAGLVTAILTYVLSLGGVYLSAFIIEKLAPSFQSQGDTVQALKLVAYAYTAAWVAGICNILPIIGIIGLLAGGIYSIYLFYLGLPVIMRTPQDKVIVYMIVSAVVIFVIYVVIALIVGAVTTAAFLGSRILTPGF